MAITIFNLLFFFIKQFHVKLLLTKFLSTKFHKFSTQTSNTFYTVHTYNISC